MTELLEGKTAIIYGGGGGIGGGVARTFAQEGARVFIAGRTRETLDAVAKDITTAGGLVEVAVLDALDERAVDDHVADVVGKAGRVETSRRCKECPPRNALTFGPDGRCRTCTGVPPRDFKSFASTGSTFQSS